MHPRPSGANDLSDRAGSPRSGLGSRRVVWGSFAVSVAVHVFAIALYPRFFERLEPSGPIFFPAATGEPDGVEVVRLMDIEVMPDEAPDEPEEIEELEEPTAETGTPVFETPGIEVVPSGPSAADRLRPHLVDARLWRTPPPEYYELTLEQREELILADRIGEWLDSVQAAQAAEEALTDWTFTDSRGGRWGISPGKIHLGDVTLPLPINLGTPVGKRDETNMLIWQWEEIMRQAARAEVQMSWRERAEAIRRRREGERADTTRGR